MLKGNLVFGQSGGPTAVINSSAAGLLTAALASPFIEEVYAAEHGIVGILEDKLFDIGQEELQELNLLTQTPSSAFGSCRHKLADPNTDESEYKRILEVFKKHNIRYFFYNGGNDTMDTCHKISLYLNKAEYECRVVGIPKTIDNDLCGTDHCPGFASAAKYVATSFMEVKLDSQVYNYPQIIIVEVMGRHAGWLAAASVLASHKGAGPDLIYLPERHFSLEQFERDVRAVHEQKGDVMVCISEGCHDKHGRFIAEMFEDSHLKTDAFGHKQLGGAAATLASFVKEKFDIKVRAIEFSLLQRCAAHLASPVDVGEAFQAGEAALKFALEGYSDFMLGFERISNAPYEIKMIRVPLAECANLEKTVPDEWINEAGNFVLQPFIDYTLPLIQGETESIEADGLPLFANLKRVLVK
ncbi:MAG: 6-phosphofructokinase [Clostridiaceae bacterium]|nr:6-phosphofructokinase [Clostridiaceae bacterium]